jgi:hypothetical protein
MDGTGVGKGRQIAGMISDAFNRGCTRSIWVGPSRGLCEDAARDLDDLKISNMPLFELGGGNSWSITTKADASIAAQIQAMGRQNPIPGKNKAAPSGHDDGGGCIFCTFASLSLPGGKRGKGGKNKKTTEQPRWKKIAEWLKGCKSGEQGILAFDEIHRAKNLVPDTHTAGMGFLPEKATKVGLAVKGLQDDLPAARVIYSSATGICRVQAVAPFARAGLWGQEAPWENFDEFLLELVGKSSQKDIGKLELLVRDFNSRGQIVSRLLDFKGVEFATEVVQVKLSSDNEAGSSSQSPPLASPKYPLPHSAYQLFLAYASEKVIMELTPSRRKSSRLDVEHIELIQEWWNHPERQNPSVQPWIKRKIEQAKRKEKKRKLQYDEDMARYHAQKSKYDEDGKRGGGSSTNSSSSSSSSSTYSSSSSSSTNSTSSTSSSSSRSVDEKKLAENGGGKAKGKRPLPGFFLKDYDAASRWFEKLVRFLKDTQGVLEAYNDNMARSDCTGFILNAQVWGASQRFFRSLLVSCKIPSVIQMAKKAYDEGMAPIIAMWSTGGSAIAQAKSHDEIVSAPRQSFALLMEKFDFEQEDDVIARSTWAKDDEKAAKIAREMHQARLEELRESFAELKLPPNPLDAIKDALGGHDHVAECSGRDVVQQRKVLNPNKFENVSRTSLFGDGKISMTDCNSQERMAFQNGTKRYALITAAASTGFSLHADKKVTNQRRRIMFVIEFTWAADNTMQQFGRCHRSNQSSAPIYKIVTAHIAGESRFASSIASKIRELGALTRGDREAAMGDNEALGQTFFDIYGKEALKQTLMTILGLRLDGSSALVREFKPPEPMPPCVTAEGYSLDDYMTDAVNAFRGQDISEKDLEKSAEPGNKNPKVNVKRFFNRILCMQTRIQQCIYLDFKMRFDLLVDTALAEGNCRLTRLFRTVLPTSVG